MKNFLKAIVITMIMCLIILGIFNNFKKVNPPAKIIKAGKHIPEVDVIIIHEPIEKNNRIYLSVQISSSGNNPYIYINSMDEKIYINCKEWGPEISGHVHCARIGKIIRKRIKL